MNDLRAILGDKYDKTIEKASRALDDGDTTDYLGCDCCTRYDYDEAVKRTGHDHRTDMAAHDALAAVLPDLLAGAWGEGFRAAQDDEADLRLRRLLRALNPYWQEQPERELGIGDSQ